MKISKSLFINYLRCQAHAPLFEVYKKKNKAIVKLTSDNDLRSFENLSKKYEILESILGEDDNIDNIDENTEAFQEEYKKVELFALKKVLNNFSGTTVPNLKNLDKQFMTKADIDGYKFYTFLDIIIENQTTIRIFEVKATTDRKYKELQKCGFLKNSKGIYQSANDRAMLNGKPIIQKEDERFLNPFKEYRHFYDLAYQRFVLEHDVKFNKEKKKVEYYLAFLNSDYVVGKEDIKKGNTTYRENDLISFFDATRITKKIIETQLVNDKDIVISYLNNMDASKIRITQTCQRGKKRECIFFDYCKKELKIPEIDNLWSLYLYSNGFKDYTKNQEKIDFYDMLNNPKIKRVQDLDDKYFTNDGKTSTEKKRFTQKLVIKNGKPKIEKELIRKWLSKLKYPLYHFDFETLNLPLPRFIGEGTYTQSPFQFSLHIEKSPGNCDLNKDNISFLATSPNKDEREQLIKTIISNIGDTGDIIAYNKSFENGVLTKLAQNFPKYKAKLENIASRLKDLEDIFKTGKSVRELLKNHDHLSNDYIFYDQRLQGKTSIKKVLPIFTDLSYNNLEDIRNGNDAMTNFFLSKTLNDQDLKRYRKNAIEYCKLDTYSMFLIIKALRDLVK